FPQSRMIPQGLLIVLLMNCSAEASVDFYSSRVFDEFDFNGQSSVTIDGLCKETCKIYASITPESKKFASNLLIEMPGRFVSIADVAAKIDPATNKKWPLVVI
ncbi:hypothetical protein PENTCL1PPCAC_25163, partial [Pristionchus entomophagus]